LEVLFATIYNELCKQLTKLDLFTEPLESQLLLTTSSIRNLIDRVSVMQGDRAAALSYKENFQTWMKLLLFAHFAQPKGFNDSDFADRDLYAIKQTSFRNYV